MPSCSNQFYFSPSINFFLSKWSHGVHSITVLPNLKINQIMLVVREAGNPSLATKINSFLIGSHRSFVGHFRNSCFSLWIFHALWFAKSFILAHTVPIVKSFGSCAFMIKWSLVLCHVVYNFVQYSTTSCEVNGRVKTSFSAKLFENDYGSLFHKRCR